MVDVGLIVTGAAAGVAVAGVAGQPAVRAALATHWAFVSIMAGLGLHKAEMVFALTAADFATALVAVLIAGHERGHPRTRAVGLLALLVMPLHMVQSATTGNLNWYLYAASLNAVFILQCLIAAGVCDGMGRRLAAFYAWFYGPAFRRGGGK